MLDFLVQRRRDAQAAKKLKVGLNVEGRGRAHRVSRNQFCVPIIVLALVMSALTWPMDSAQATARGRPYIPRHHTDALAVYRPAAGTTGVR